MPTFSCPGNIDVATCTNDAIVTWADPIFMDNCDPLLMICDPPSGSSFPIGLTTVTCTAIDQENNTYTCTFDVQVIEDCSGCPQVINLANTTANGLYHAENIVSATNTITSGTNVAFKAGDIIELQNSFSAPASTDFSAEIEDCVPVIRSTSDICRTKDISDEECVEIIPSDTTTCQIRY